MISTDGILGITTRERMYLMGRRRGRQPDPKGIPLTTDIGRRLSAARRARGLSQADLAAATTISRVTISQIENGHRTRVNPSVLETLAAAVGTPFQQLYGGPAVLDLLQPTPLSPQFGVVLLKLVALPGPHQERVLRCIEHLLIWYEADVLPSS